MTAIPHDNRINLVANFDGTDNTQFPDGDKPVSGPVISVDVAAFAALVPSPLNVKQGTAVSYDVRSVFRGQPAEVAAATLSIVTVSGDSPAANGWSISGDNLVADGTGNGAGILDILAKDRFGNPVNTPQVTWSYFIDSGVDDLAPTVPAGASGVMAGSVLQMTWDSSADNYDGSVTPSGLDHYNVYVNGSKAAPSPVVAPNRGATGQKLVFTDIGGAGSTAVQTNTNWALTSAGAGFTSTAAEELGFLGCQLSGDQAVSLQIDSLGAGVCGLMVRESLVPGAVFGCIYATASAIRVEVRSVPGQAGSTQASVALTPGRCRLRIDRGGTFLLFLYSLDGGQWNVLASISVSMAQTAQWGAAYASGVHGTARTGGVLEFNSSAKPQVSASVAISAISSIAVSAVDALGNESAVSRAVAAAIQQINFVPGHYVGIGGLATFNGVLDFTTNADLVIARDTNNVVKGFFIVFGFGQCEGAFGDYSSWFSTVQQCLDYCNSLTPKRSLSIEINISGNVGSASVPSYMLNNSTYGQVVSGTGYMGGLFNGPSAGTQAGTVRTVRYDIPATAARIAAAGAALYREFGNEIDSFNPTFSEIEDFRVFVPQMTSAAITASFAGPGGMFDQLRAGMPPTYLMFSPSFMSLSDFPALFAATDRNMMSVGAYDFTNEVAVRSGGTAGPNRGAIAFRGGQLVSGVFQPVAGLIDRRANVAGGGRDYWGHVGPDELGQRTATAVVPPAKIGDGDIANAIWPAAQLMQCSKMIWYANRQVGPDCNTVTHVAGAPANYAGANWANLIGFLQTVTVPAGNYPRFWQQ